MRLTPASGPDLHQSWADFIGSRDWQLFITHTFIDNVGHELAERHLYKFFNAQNIRYYGKRYQLKPVCLEWVAGLEYQKRGAIHFHSLVGNVPADYRFDTGLHDWKLTGRQAGIAKIERVHAHADVVAYVTKYVTKEGEILLSPQLNLMRRDSYDSGRESIPLSL